MGNYLRATCNLRFLFSFRDDSKIGRWDWEEDAGYTGKKILKNLLGGI